MKKPENDKISGELADKLSKLDTPEKERAEILARVAEVRARFQAKKKAEKEKA
jgi:hypothetical protein